MSVNIKNFGTFPWQLTTVTNLVAVPWLRRLVAGLSLRMPWLIPKPARVGFVVDTLTLGQTINTSM